MTCYASRNLFLLTLLATPAIVVAAPISEKSPKDSDGNRVMGTKSRVQTVVISIAIFLVLFVTFAAFLYSVRGAIRRARLASRPAARRQVRRRATAVNAANPPIEFPNRVHVGPRNNRRANGTNTIPNLPPYDPAVLPGYTSKATGSPPYSDDRPSARPSTSAVATPLPEEDITIQAIPRAELANRSNTPSPPQAVPNSSTRGPL